MTVARELRYLAQVRDLSQRAGHVCHGRDGCFTCAALAVVCDRMAAGLRSLDPERITNPRKDRAR